MEKKKKEKEKEKNCKKKHANLIQNDLSGGSTGQYLRKLSRLGRRIKLKFKFLSSNQNHVLKKNYQ